MKKKWSQLLENFVDFTHVFKEAYDPEFHVPWLYDRINKSGFKISRATDTDLVEHGKDIYLTIYAMFAVMVGAVGVQLKDYAVLHSVVAEPLPLKFEWSIDKGSTVDLGQAGTAGIAFILWFLMEVQGVTMVKQCKYCDRFFFPKNVKREYCYPPRKCKEQQYINNRREKTEHND